ncbi:two-component system, OmpR family, phosphate regulon sensor histidine kinase PhoR [Seinonella peptonophila]|uniref:histidine kinase n=1 Tax=Seinonella peptonophila TaxID=112248 RepID=A0A1M4W3Q6_9BACL|nr:HAMP domain-containing histidine kinase [Seinonella peptonophila]SHE75780.1 two-component system, OmpR family, phosphate regulon sensor histidine kinase PhoR [Seinonella peptonophila]
MSHTLKSRIIQMLWVLIGSTVLVSGLFFWLLIQEVYDDFLSDRLLREGEWIAQNIDWEQMRQDPNIWREQRNQYKKMFKFQAELTDAKSFQAKKPIVKSYDEKLTGTFPIHRSGQIVGFLSLELNREQAEVEMDRLRNSLIGGMILISVLAALASSRVAIQVVRPIEEMAQVAIDLTKKRFYRRVHGRGNDEVGRLGHAINRVAHHLQKQMNALRQSEQRLISVMETMESGLLLVDGAGMIRFVNQSFERSLSYSTGSLIGQSYQVLDQPFGLFNLIEQCINREQKIHDEVTLYLPQEQIYEVVVTPMWEDPQGVSVVVMIHNMTAVRRLEQMRKDFVANVSHELKTPITSIRGFSETLLDGAMSDQATSREFLQIIHDESIRLQRLVADLLDLSQLESKQMSIHPEWTQMKPLIDSVVKTMEEQAKNRKQKLSVQVDSFSAKVDVDGFRQILINLLSNAVAYTPDGGTITVTAKPINDGWELCVADSGIGIPKKDLDRIFERFYRVNKDRSRESGGTGLGLAIVKHLVELHRGDIYVDSKVSEGSKFRIVFPMEESSDR